MAAITQTELIVRELNSVGGKCIEVETPATADNSDTFTVDLPAYGIKSFLGIDGYGQTTAGSVVVAEAPTTSVSSGTLTVTLGAVAGSNKVRFFRIYGR